MNSFDLNAALETYPVCQRRTGRNKQFVLLVDDKVVKGPFKKERLETIMQRKAILKEWATPMTVFPFDDVLTDPNYPGGFFLTYPNLATGYPVKCDPHKESFSDYSYQVLQREGLLKASAAIKKKASEFIVEQLENLILALTHLYILGVGDVHLANVLVDLNKKTIHVVDYDENRGSERQDEFFYLSKLPSKETAQLITHYGRPHYASLVSRLRTLPKVPDDCKERLEKAITLFQAYSNVAPAALPKERAKPKLVITSDTPITQEDLKKLTIPQLKVLLEEKGLRKTGRKEDLINRLVSASTETREPGPVGKMVWRGLMGGSLTYSGHPLDEIKSALQKYVRRGMLEKALQCAFELYRMKELKGMGAETNLFNRIGIIAVEDIGPANFPLVIEVLRRLNTDRRDPAELGALVQVLSDSEKTRLPSHLRKAYGTQDGRQELVKRGRSVDLEFPDITPSELEEKGFWKSEDPDELKPYAEMFYYRLNARDANAEVWLSYYLQMSEGFKVTPRNRRTNPDIIIWEILSLVIEKEVHDIFKKAYYSHTENGPFMMSLVTAYLWEAPMDQIDMDEGVENWRKSPMLNQLLNGEYTLELDPYVVDKHTRRGKQQGADRTQFVEEGSHVENQSVDYYDAELHEIYNTM